MGRVGLSELVTEAYKVRDFHSQYREFLRNDVEGYVFDNRSSTLYILVSKAGKEEFLERLVSDYEGLNVGILHVPKEKISEEMGHYFSFSDMERCA